MQNNEKPLWSGIFQHCLFSFLALQSKDVSACLISSCIEYLGSLVLHVRASLSRDVLIIYIVLCTSYNMNWPCIFINRRAVVFISTHRRKVCNLGVIGKLHIFTYSCMESKPDFCTVLHETGMFLINWDLKVDP